MRTIELTERKKSNLISGMLFAAECGVNIIKEVLEDFDFAKYGLNPETAQIEDAWQAICDEGNNEEAVNEFHCREEVYDTYLQALSDLDVLHGADRYNALNAFGSLFAHPVKKESYDKYMEYLEIFLESLISLEGENTNEDD